MAALYINGHRYMPEQPEKAEKQQAEREQKRRASQIIVPLAARRQHATDGSQNIELEVMTNTHAAEQPCASNNEVVEIDKTEYDNVQSTTDTSDMQVTAYSITDDTFH